MKKSLALLLALVMLVMALPLTASAASKTMYVKTDNGLSLNVRSSMKTHTDNVITHLAYGKKVTVISEIGSWAKISWGTAKRGYVVKKYLSAKKPAAKTAYRYVKTDNHKSVNLRSSMSTKKNNIIRIIPYLAKVRLIDTYTGGWAKVTYSGKTGYMLSKYLSLKK